MCKKNRAKEYYKNNRDVILNSSKEYYINNKESISIYYLIKHADRLLYCFVSVFPVLLSIK